MNSKREPWEFDAKTLQRIQKKIVPYLRGSRKRDLLGLNFASIEAMADLIEDMAKEIKRLRK